MTSRRSTRRRRRPEAVLNQARIASCHDLGLPPDVIARRLKLSRKCVYEHLKSIKEHKIDSRETAEAIARRTAS